MYSFNSPYLPEGLHPKLMITNIDATATVMIFFINIELLCCYDAETRMHHCDAVFRARRPFPELAGWKEIRRPAAGADTKPTRGIKCKIMIYVKSKI
jgi:hypothetical protein